MKLPKIATHCISTNKTDELIYSWNTIKSIVNEVFEDCFRVTRHGTLVRHKVYWRIGGNPDDMLYLTGLNPNYIVMHTFDNIDHSFVVIRFSGVKGIITIDKFIDVRHMQPFFTCDAGLMFMSDVVDRIIDKLEETFGKKEEENKMTNQEELHKKLKEFIAAPTSEVIENITKIISNMLPTETATRGESVSNDNMTKKERNRRKGHPAPTFNEFEVRILNDIHHIIINRPSVVVFWNETDENGKYKITTVTCQPGDTFSKEEGIMRAIALHYGDTPKLVKYLAKNADDRSEITETHRKNKAAAKEKALRKKEEEAEKRVDTLMNETQSPAMIGFLNVEEE